MAQIHFIRRDYASGYNISEIGRRHACSRDTVRKMLTRDDWNLEKPFDKRKRRSKLESFKSIIDGWLLGDSIGPKKQRHTAKRVHERLLAEAEGFNCSYRSVASYVRDYRAMMKKGEGFLPLKHPGGEAQADFGEVWFTENGTRYRGHALTVSYPNSNAGFVQLFKSENCECLTEGLKKVFEHVGKSPTRLWMDNASAQAVMRRGSSEGSVMTDAFARFAIHYGFDVTFCNPGAANEKGSVENKVGYLRRNLMVPEPVIADLEEYNMKLLAECDRMNSKVHYRKGIRIQELLEDEKALMRALPSNGYDCCRIEAYTADGWGKISTNGGRHVYSASPEVAKQQVYLNYRAAWVDVLDKDGKLITRHKRLYGETMQEAMDPLPYLGRMARSPRAIRYMGLYDMMPSEVREHLSTCDRRQVSEMLKALAQIASKDGFDLACKSIRHAIVRGVSDFDSIIMMHSWLNSPVLSLEKVDAPACMMTPAMKDPDMGMYDALAGLVAP